MGLVKLSKIVSHIVYLVYDEVEVDGLLPVDVGVPNRQLPAVPSKHLEKEMKFTEGVQHLSGVFLP